MSIPRVDPNYTMADLAKVADEFTRAGQAYWEAAHKAGLDGAVIWLQNTDGSFLLFTRGEYKDVLTRNIHEIGPTKMFGATEDAEEPSHEA